VSIAKHFSMMQTE
jgi:hypothetical protein